MMFGPTFGICNNRDYFALWAYYSNTALKKLHPSRYKYIVIVRKIYWVNQKETRNVLKFSYSGRSPSTS